MNLGELQDEIRQTTSTQRPVKIWATKLEAEAEQQVRNLANLPFIFHHVAVMADAHAGKGSTVGTVIATKGAIIPAAVGVDIGCGMAALKLPFSVERLGGSAKLAQLRSDIEARIPVGFNRHENFSSRRQSAFDALGECSLLHTGKDAPMEHELIFKNAALQVGTLGGGNHFIEVCSDQQGQAWIMLHSGSRNVGKVLAERHIERAQGLMKEYFIDLPDPDLAYLVNRSPEFKTYIHDLRWAQNYAKINRNEMMLQVLEAVYKVVSPGSIFNPDLFFRVDCHHNYTTMENHFGHNIWVTRKGAVSARKGEYGIIPGSMGTKSYIVKGKGNPESFCSCSHGAGRRMSRTEARKKFTLEDLAAQTSGVECRKDAEVIDEIPSAYKDIDEVMANQADLVEVLFELKQLICIKG